MYKRLKVNFADAATSTSMQRNLCNGISIANWSVSKKDVVYDRGDFHTLSLYLTGGFKSYRSDKPSIKGGPGKFSFMPRQHQSQWAIRDAIDFVHLYIPQKTLDWFFVSTFEKDVREANLRDLLYKNDQRLSSKILRIATSIETGKASNILSIEQDVIDILYHLFTSHLLDNITHNVCTGGLSPLHRKRVRDYVYSHFSEKIRIADMADTTGLSVFHFAKMFKLSFGICPAEFVTLFRINEIKRLLGTNSSLSEISLETGFSQQSHMTSTFKSITGKTPAQYRKQINE